MRIDSVGDSATVVEALDAWLGWIAVEAEEVRLVQKRHARAARRLVAQAAFATTAW